MGRTASQGFFFAVVILFAAMLSSCGGGGGGGGGSSGPAAPVVATGTATGTVIDGPISGATVQVFDFTGNVRGNLLGTGTTDASGNYTITLTPRPTGPVQVVASGGTYIEEATGTQTTLTAADQFTEIVPATSISNGALTAHVNPLNHIANNLAMLTSGTLGIDNAIFLSKGVLGQQYGISVLDLSSNLPISPINPVLTAPPTINQRQAGLILAGFSQLANTLGVRTYDLVKAIADDYSDGKLDGKKNAANITIPKIGGGTVTLTATAALADLQAAINTFLASANNKSGMTAMTLASTTPIQAINLGLNNAGLVFVRSDVLPAFITGVQSTVQLQAAGGTPPYNWSNLTACPGVNVSAAGVLTATGVTLGSGSSMSISAPCQVTVTDTRGQSATFTFRITTVAAAPTITAVAGGTMTTGVQGAVIVANASGGTPPYFFSKATGGAFPPLGTSITTSSDNKSALVSGTPSVAGVYTFDVCVADLGRTNKCTSATVTVNDPPRANITVTNSGTGSGSTTAAGTNNAGAVVTGASCGTGCTSFPVGTKVTLTATPASGSTFAGWSGGGCTGTGSCLVTLNANTNVTATFTQAVVAGTFPGKWVGTWSRPSFGFCDNTFFTLTLNLTQSGSSLGGNYSAVVTAVDGFCPDRVGTVKSDNVAFGSVSGSTFSVTMSGGTVFSGTLSGTKLTGNGGTSSGTGPFNLNKQ